MGACFIYLFDI